MELIKQHVAGNTWCIWMPQAVIPYYHLTQTDIILMDSGCLTGGELEQWLEEQGLHVCAILTTHDHWDHVAASMPLQKKHGSKIYLPKLEAATHATDLARLTAHMPGNYHKICEFYAPYCYTVDEEIGLEDGVLEVCGASFEAIHTPGHSVDHVSYLTPDRVLYVGDTLMSGQMLRQAKLSYAISHEVDIESKRKLLSYDDCAAYVLAHRSVESSIADLVEANIAYVEGRADEIWRMVTSPMSMEEIIRIVWKHFGLRSGFYYKNVEIGNMIRVLVQYLVSMGRFECRYYDGVDYYARVREQENAAWK